MDPNNNKHKGFLENKSKKPKVRLPSTSSRKRIVKKEEIDAIQAAEEIKWQLWNVQRFNCSLPENADKQHEVKLGHSVNTDAQLNTVLDKYKPSDHIVNSQKSLAFFKKGIRPIFEDDQNFYGGRFFYKETIVRLDVLDDIWNHLCTKLMQQSIGADAEGRSYHDKICGVKIHSVGRSVTKSFKFQIWSEIVIPHNHVKEMKDCIKSKLKLSCLPEYEFHSHRPSFIDLQKLGLLRPSSPALCDQCKRDP